MNIIKIILFLFLISFLYHLGMLIIVPSCNLIGWNSHGLIHLLSILFCAAISYICYRRIIKKKPPEEK